MAKKRIPRQKVREIAQQRMLRLTEMAVQKVREGDAEHARRYMEIARRISMRTQTPMPPEPVCCKGCMQPMVPGLNSRVRVRNGRVVLHCLVCDRCIRTKY